MEEKGLDGYGGFWGYFLCVDVEFLVVFDYLGMFNFGGWWLWVSYLGVCFFFEVEDDGLVYVSLWCDDSFW